jgi:hypothetical protein
MTNAQKFTRDLAKLMTKHNVRLELTDEWLAVVGNERPGDSVAVSLERTNKFGAALYSEDFLFGPK